MGPAVGWRTPFAIVGASIIAVGLLLPHLVVEPTRGQQDGNVLAQEDGRPENNQHERLPAAILHLFKTPTIGLIFLQGISGCVPWAVIQTFLADYLAETSGLGIPKATTVMFFFGFGVGIGTIAGGSVGQQAYQRDKRLQPALMSATAAGGMAPMLGLLCAPVNTDIWILYLLAFLGGSLAAISGSNAKAVLLNVTPPQVRGTAFGVYNIMDDLGKGVGPVFVAKWVQLLGSRELSFLLGIGCWLPCSIFNFLICFTVVSDEQMLVASRREIVVALESRPASGATAP